MNTYRPNVRRPQPLLAPRPIRQHPLDEIAQAQVELDTDSKRALYKNLCQLYSTSPEGYLDPHPSGRDLWLGLLLCLAVVGGVLYGLWQLLEWGMQ